MVFPKEVLEQRASQGFLASIALPSKIPVAHLPGRRGREPFHAQLHEKPLHPPLTLKIPLWEPQAAPAPGNPDTSIPWEGLDEGGLVSVWFHSSMQFFFLRPNNFMTPRVPT